MTGVAALPDFVCRSEFLTPSIAQAANCSIGEAIMSGTSNISKWWWAARANLGAGLNIQHKSLGLAHVPVELSVELAPPLVASRYQVIPGIRTSDPQGSPLDPHSMGILAQQSGLNNDLFNTIAWKER
jgi:hypothetical protein